MPSFVSMVKWRAKALLRRLTGGSTLVDCWSMMQSCAGTFFPCLRGMRSAKYASLEDGVLNDQGQVTADRVGSVLMFVSVVSYIFLMLKFSAATKIEDMDEFTRNLPLIMYATILEILICGASARTAALMYKQRRHVRKHPNDMRNAEYIKVGPLTRQDLTDAWGFSFHPSTDGIEALLVESIYKSSPVAQWNDTFEARLAAKDLAKRDVLYDGEDADECDGSADDNAMNVDDEKPVKAKKTSMTSLEMVDINLALDVEANDAADEMPPIEDGRFSFGLAIVAINDVHGDVGPMQIELLTAHTVTFYCHQFLGDPTVEDSDLEKEALKPNAGIIGFATEPAQTESNNDISVLGLEDEQPEMLIRWVLCSFTLGWVTLLPIVLLAPHEERPRQTQFRDIFFKPSMIILPIWILMWLADTVSIMLHSQFMSPFVYYISIHMVLAGIIVILGMKLQAKDTEHVLHQRKIRREEIDALRDGENKVAVRPFVVEDPAPTILRELLVSNPLAIVVIGSLVAIPLVIGQVLYPLKTERGKLAQTYVFATFGVLSLLQLGTLGLLWNLRFESMPFFYAHGAALLLWYPCLIGYCICLICSGHYAKRDVDLCRRQRQERAKEYVGVAGVETGETRYKEWDLCFSA